MKKVLHVSRDTIDFKLFTELDFFERDFYQRHANFFFNLGKLMFSRKMSPVTIEVILNFIYRYFTSNECTEKVVDSYEES